MDTQNKISQFNYPKTKKLFGVINYLSQTSKIETPVFVDSFTKFFNTVAFNCWVMVVSLNRHSTIN